MGLSWSSEETVKECEEKALEALHEAVWDKGKQVNVQCVRALLAEHRVTCVASVHSLRNELKNAEAEQARKVRAYERNKEPVWAQYHSTIGERYRRVGTAMLCIIYKGADPDEGLPELPPVCFVEFPGTPRS